MSYSVPTTGINIKSNGNNHAAEKNNFSWFSMLIINTEETDPY